MGFTDAKRQVINCLNKGQYSHEARGNIDIKNLLATGDVTPEDVATILGRSRGNEYSCSPHDYDSSVDVHIVKTTHQGINWYIKWYFIEPDVVFISVHP
ncbi:MAG: hypothetical protein HND53_01475 [Proteobacteria bacterium]|nr:hypothetical protein [Pseudomonadota bacterium]NOG59141.1 hypothetical protein [Pseudomonadota bacterium]